jgi:hypothetical protein
MLSGTPGSLTYVDDVPGENAQTWPQLFTTIKRPPTVKGALIWVLRRGPCRPTWKRESDGRCVE